MWFLLRNSIAQKVSVLGKKYMYCQTVRSYVRCLATDKRRKGHDNPGRDRKTSVRETDREQGRGKVREDRQNDSAAAMKDLLNKMDAGSTAPTQVNH